MYNRIENGTIAKHNSEKYKFNQYQKLIDSFHKILFKKCLIMYQQNITNPIIKTEYLINCVAHMVNLNQNSK